MKPKRGSGNSEVNEPRKRFVSIKGWPEGERPREKMAAYGAPNLSEGELLAVLMRTGVRGTTALDIARKLMDVPGGWRSLAVMPVHELERIENIGRVRACSIAAAFELGRRIERPNSEGRAVITCPQDVFAMFRPRMRDRQHEEFHVLLLDSAKQVIREMGVSSGILNSSLVHPRECFKDAIKAAAASVIFIHNHPSGNPEPSAEDIQITRQLAEAGRILNIPVDDHVIIAGDTFTSLLERGIL